MARSKTSVSARLNRLIKAKERIFALPRGELLKAKPMAKALGISWPILLGWCDDIDGFEQSGAFERGAQGMDYQFCPVRTVWFLIEHFEAMRAEFSGKTRKKPPRLVSHSTMGMTPNPGKRFAAAPTCRSRSHRRRSARSELVKQTS